MKEENYSNIQFFKDLWSFLDGYKGNFIFGSICRFFGEMHTYINPLILGLVVNFLISYKSGPITILYWYVLIYILSGIFATSIRFYSKYTLIKIAALSKKNMRLEAMNKMVSLDLAWHGKEDSGTKVSKINTGVDSIKVAMSSFFNDWYPIAIGLVTGSLLLFFISWKFFVFSILTIVIFLWTYLSMVGRLQSYKEDTLKANEKVEGKLYETTSNILALKSLG
ncbi:hypothetical protein KY334_03860, partial [Candidatus Woesearchaeota archaeon]|nr:hypothetical protein [Candidatus Woesearchaeota archaeon]